MRQLFFNVLDFINLIFDRSLLKILDHLETSEQPHFHLLSEAFLSHSLLRGDISRILHPLLLKLLPSNTARVLIGYINESDSSADLYCQFDNDSCFDDNDTRKHKIYAISNENGNVMYHVDREQKPVTKRKWFPFTKSNNNNNAKKYSPAVMINVALDEFNNAVTTTTKKTLKKIDKTNDRVKVTINPLSSKEVYPDGVDGSYSKLESRRSSSDSSISMDLTENVNVKNGRDSGYDSFIKSKTQLDLLSNTSSKLFESIEPIEDGIANCPPKKLPKSQSFDEKICQNGDLGENMSLVHSWSYCLSDSDVHKDELESSISAEEFFKNDGEIIVCDVLNDILDSVLSKTSERSSNDVKKNSTQSRLYPIHSHICLYYDVFDSDQVIYALQTLKRCVCVDPHQFIKCASTGSVTNIKNSEIVNLLARHRKSLLGYGFDGDLSQEYLSFYRGWMFLEVVVAVCVDFSRSFYPFPDDDVMVKLATRDLRNNVKIQLESLDILDLLVRHLVVMVTENGKGFSNYIADMLVKCKLQNVVLHCLLTSVRNFDDDMTFAEEVLLFNNFQLYNGQKVGENVEAYQIQLLR